LARAARRCAQAALGPMRHRAGGLSEPAVLVNVSGFKSRSPGACACRSTSSSNFLVKGKRVRRIDLPVTSADADLRRAAGAGTYAVAVRHDVDGDNDKSGDWSDGGGFSRNPKISLLKLKPSFARCRSGRQRREAGQRGAELSPGLSIGPVERS
jgi:uncharacterized protein (DUF2141 family)